MGAVLCSIASEMPATIEIVPPAFSPDAIQAAVLRVYGVEGTLRPVSGERDQVFLLVSNAGKRFILRVSNQHDTIPTLLFQNHALLHIEARDPGLPVPRVCHTVEGDTIEVIEEKGIRYGLRLLSFVDGIRMAEFPPSSALRFAVGRLLGRLDGALADFSYPPTAAPVIWDVARAHALRSLLLYVDDPDLAQLLASVFDRAEHEVAPALATLRHQCIHNDFTPNNVLLDADDPTQISGIIDFGDLMQGALIVDLAVAIARQVTTSDPVGDACELAGAFSEVMPLSEKEVGLLCDLACARLAMRLAVWKWRSKTSYVRYERSQFDTTRVILKKLYEAGSAKVTERLLAACQTTS